MKTTLIAVAAVGAALTLLPPADTAGAAPGKLVPAGAQALPEAGAVGLSADGRSAYVSHPDRLAVYVRDAASGTLTFAECFGGAGAPECAQIPATEGAFRDIEVPLDGGSVYVGGGLYEALIGFRRDPGSGELTFSSCEYSSYGAGGDLPGCPMGSFEEVRQIELHRDGRTLFSADRACADNTGDCFAGIGVYVRDPASSSLDQTDFIAPRFSGTGEFAVGRAGLAALEPERSAISSFRRLGPAKLKYAGCLSRAPKRVCRTVRSMGTPRAAAAMGNTVVTGGGGRIAVFSQGKKGALRLRSTTTIRTGEVRELAFSSDGRSLIALTEGGSRTALLRFKVNPRKKRVALAQCFAEAAGKGCAPVPELDGARELDALRGWVYALAPQALAGFRQAGG